MSTKQDQAYNVLFQLYALGRRVKSFAKHRNQDLMLEAMILGSIARGECHVSTLARALSTKVSALSEKIAELESRGLVTKTVDQDQRERMLTLTVAGVSESAEIETIMKLHCLSVFDALETEELSTLARLIDKLVSSMHKEKV